MEICLENLYVDIGAKRVNEILVRTERVDLQDRFSVASNSSPPNWKYFRCIAHERSPLGHS